MAIVYVKGNNWNALKEKLQATGQDVYKAQDSVVAKTAATARPKAFEVEREVGLRQGKVQEKYFKGGVKRTKTRWNATGGYWESQSGRRLMSFNFERSASRYAKGVHAGQLKPNVISRVALTSITANLWEYDTKPYSKKSPRFGSEGGSGIWKQGEIRRGRKYFMTKVYTVVEQTVPEAIAKTERQIFTKEKGYE